MTGVQTCALPIFKHEPWPFTTLKRFEYFLSAREEILDSDYSFYVDVDSLFIKEIQTSILSGKGMIGTIHPCLFVGPGSPERNPESKACIPMGSDSRYFCGGFFGGSSKEFIETSESILSNIQDDLQRGIIADRKSTRLNSSHIPLSRMPSSA